MEHTNQETAIDSDGDNTAKAANWRNAAAAENALTPEVEKELSACAERLVALGRRTTSQAFEYGETLARAQAILPDKRFGKWLKAHCGITTRAAKNYTRVSKELAHHRERLERTAVPPTVMFALLGAQQDAVETVLGTYEGGERLTAASIRKLMIKPGKEVSTPKSYLDVSGKEGCLKVAEMRTKENVETLYNFLAKILSKVEEAVLAARTGARIVKSDLAKHIELDSRHAHEVLKLTLAPVVEGYHQHAPWTDSPIDKTTSWGKVQKALHELGYESIWPKRLEFNDWLVHDIYPALRFAVHGEPMSAASTEENAPAALLKQHGDEGRQSQDDRLQLDAPGMQPVEAESHLEGPDGVSKTEDLAA